MGKTQACSSESSSGQKVKGKVDKNLERQNKTANEEETFGSRNLKSAIGVTKQRSTLNERGEISSIIDNFASASTSSMGNLQLSSAEADSATLLSQGDDNSNNQITAAIDDQSSALQHYGEQKSTALNLMTAFSNV